MQKEELIAIDEFCANYNIDVTFIISLQEFDLIEIIRLQETSFISTKDLVQIEKLIRLHYELDINLEGIATISHMLEQINTLQQKIIFLENQLRIYETNKEV